MLSFSMNLTKTLGLMKHISFHSTKEHLNHFMIGLYYTEILTWQKVNREFVKSSSQKIFTDLANDNYLKDYATKSKSSFSKKLAYYKCELNALHPFYEQYAYTHV